MLGQGGKAAVSQRRRWEFGRRELSRRVLVPLLRSTHLNLIEKFASVLELTMPPMVLILVDYLAWSRPTSWSCSELNTRPGSLRS